MPVCLPGCVGALAPLAVPLAFVAALLWIWSLFESIAGLTAPALGDEGTLYAVWTGLLVVLVVMNIAFVGSAARDLAAR